MGAHIQVVGLGAGDPGHLTLAGWQAIQKAERLILRTQVHPTVAYLQQAGIHFETFDHLYDEASSFAELYPQMVEALMEAASAGSLVFAVPGHPCVGEKTVELLVEAASAAGVTVEIIPGLSFLEALYPLVGVDPSQGLLVLDALDLSPLDLSPRHDTVVTQVFSRPVASELKLTLMEVYPDEYPITVVRAAGVPGLEKVCAVALFELDRLSWIDHLTSVFIPAQVAAMTGERSPEAWESGQDHSDKDKEQDQDQGQGTPLNRLMEVMRCLLGPEGCPWDREQTHQSLKPYLLEEAYEVLDAIDEGNDEHLTEELGDVLLQVVFHGVIAEQRGAFAVDDVIRAITEKMLRRHPHVFADATVSGAEEVVTNWDMIKRQEKGAVPESVLGKIPASWPALQRAQKIQAKAARVGFDWPDAEGPRAKVLEEWQELLEAIERNDQAHMREELGDLLFAVVNLARFLQVHPEEALHRTVDKFVRRFQGIEGLLRQEKRSWEDCTLAQLDEYWDKVKQEERQRH